MEQVKLEELYEELAATGERPVERSASRWLGEAEAIAADVARSDLDPSVRRERLSKVESLLGNVESTGDERADEHVERARTTLAALLGDD